MLRPTLALLALLIPQGLLASEVHVSTSGFAGDRAPSGAYLMTATAPVPAVTEQSFQKDGPATPVRFDVDALRPLRLEVVSPTGEVVNTLARGLWAAGRHELAWYGVDDAGEAVDDGLYSIRLTLEEEAPSVALLSAPD